MSKLKCVWCKSWAHAWGVTKISVAGIGASVHYMGGLINDGGVKSAIDSLHLDPKLMLGLAVLGAITVLSAPHDA